MKTFAQSEIYARQIDTLPDGLEPFTEKTKGGDWIISHSESGHHHLKPGDGVDVMERPTSEGVRILYAIVKEPSRLFQDAAVPHDAHEVPPGVYEMRIAREYDPFMQQARRVAD